MIAHPGRYKFTANEEYALFTEFKAHGGRAIEVVTGSHSPAEYVEYADKALEYGFAASRGSDFHSPDESHMRPRQAALAARQADAGLGTARATASGERRAQATGAQGATEQTRDLESERILAGIGLVILAVACFATLDTATKVSSAPVPILMGVWFRYAFQAVATTLVLLPRHGTALLRTAHPQVPVLRGACC